MQKYRKQKGITLIGFLIILAMLGFCIYIGMRLVPVYLEYYSVVQAMEQLKNEPGAASMSPQQIRTSLDKKFYISYVSSIKPKHIKIVQRGGGRQVNITYEVRGPLVSNLDFVASFNRTVELTNAVAN